MNMDGDSTSASMRIVLILHIQRNGSNIFAFFMFPNALQTIFDPLKGKSPKTFENAYDL